MAQIIDPQERAWIEKLSREGIDSLGSEFQAAESWERYIKDSGEVLQYPSNLGYDQELQNYVLFDIYEVVGQSFKSSEDSPEDPNESSKDKKKREAKKQKQEEEAEKLSKGISKGLAEYSGETVSKANEKQALDTLGSEIAAGFEVTAPEVDPVLLRQANRGIGLASANSVRLGFSQNIRSVNLSIALPMPAQLNSNYGFEYEEVDYSGLMSMIAGTNTLKNMAVEGKEMDAESKELLRKVSSIPQSLIDSLSNIIGSHSVNLVDAMNMRRAQAPNKFKEQTFKGVGRRSFTFEWELSPRSREDALRIYSIVYAFKKFSHPSRTEGGLYLNYPAQFKIGFYSKSVLNDFLFRIALCGCTKCEVTYGGEDLTFFRDFVGISSPFTGQNFHYGAPANTIKLSLEFTEMELLTQERIKQGY